MTKEHFRVAWLHHQPSFNPILPPGPMDRAAMVRDASSISLALNTFSHNNNLIARQSYCCKLYRVTPLRATIEATQAKNMSKMLVTAAPFSPSPCRCFCNGGTAHLDSSAAAS
jgi:hypothetical protein